MQNPSSSSEPVGLRTRSKRKKISQNPKDDSDKNQPKVGKFSILDDNSKTKQKDTKDPDEEVCPVCFDKPLHPLTLQCGHIYCFLCAKGLAESNLMSGGSCCLCRKQINKDLFKHPQLQKIRNDEKETGGGTSSSDGTCWFYEGRNGWWKFGKLPIFLEINLIFPNEIKNGFSDQRNNEDIEKIYEKQKSPSRAEFLICGNIYIIDFQSMTQYR